jgi:hypothetical protein
MAQLNDLIVSGSTRLIGDIYTNGSIITPGDDDKGIIPAQDNYGQIGSTNNRFYRGYINTLYTSNIPITNTTETLSISSTYSDTIYYRMVKKTNIGVKILNLVFGMKAITASSSMVQITSSAMSSTYRPGSDIEVMIPSAPDGAKTIAVQVLTTGHIKARFSYGANAGNLFSLYVWYI